MVSIAKNSRSSSRRLYVSLAFSPTSDFLVTTHVDDLGVYLWSNMTLYEHVALRPLPADYEPQLTIAMPSSSRATQGITSPVTAPRDVVTVGRTVKLLFFHG